MFVFVCRWEDTRVGEYIKRIWGEIKTVDKQQYSGTYTLTYPRRIYN